MTTRLATIPALRWPGMLQKMMTLSELQPISLRYNFKLGKGRVRKIGTTDLEKGDVVRIA